MAWASYPHYYNFFRDFMRAILRTVSVDVNGEESRITMIEVNNWLLLLSLLFSSSVLINYHKIEVLVSISTISLLVKQRTDKYSKKSNWIAVNESYEVREGVNGKKRFLSGIARIMGGGLPMPEIFGPLFRSAFLVNKKSLFLQKCQCIELLTIF